MKWQTKPQMYTVIDFLHLMYINHQWQLGLVLIIRFYIHAQLNSSIDVLILLGGKIELSHTCTEEYCCSCLSGIRKSIIFLGGLGEQSSEQITYNVIFTVAMTALP